jgi:hypothetical protein
MSNLNYSSMFTKILLKKARFVIAQISIFLFTMKMDEDKINFVGRGLSVEEIKALDKDIQKVKLTLWSLIYGIRHKYIRVSEDIMQQVRENHCIDFDQLTYKGKTLVRAYGVTAIAALTTRVCNATTAEEAIAFLVGQGAYHLAFAVATATFYGDIPVEVLTSIRLWHGSIAQKFEAIQNDYDRLNDAKTQWKVPTEMLTKLQGYVELLRLYINKGRTSLSAEDRSYRNEIMHEALLYCLFDVKIWVYGQAVAKVIAPSDVHLLGYLLPGEQGGKRGRTEATDIEAEAKVLSIGMDHIKVIVDTAGKKAAAPVAHSFPEGVKFALIVVMTADGREILRITISKVHTDIHIPEEYRGQQLIIKAAFLKHHDDDPKFGTAQATLLMPKSVEDLHSTLDAQHAAILANREARIAELEAQIAAQQAAKK